MFEEDDRPVCSTCIGEPYLAAEVERDGLPAICAFCDRPGQTISVEDLAGHIEGAFDRHYRMTSDQPSAFEHSLLADKESDYSFERAGEPVLWAIAAAARIEEDVAQAVLDILSDRYADTESDRMGDETEFATSSYYGARDANDIEFELEWRAFERAIKRESRFFNAHARRLFERLFADLETYVGDETRPPIRSAGPGTELEIIYRARAFHRTEILHTALQNPERDLGPPPTRFAAGGRMNAVGVAVFYGALERDAALSEARPVVGSTVVVGCFEIIRPLRLLDIEALRDAYVEGSEFDPNYLDRLECARFLRRLCRRMTLPVMPDDEASEYLVTQAICDFLAGGLDLRLDGLIFPSVQMNLARSNVVLFHKAARVVEPGDPAGTIIEVHALAIDDDDDDDDDGGSHTSTWVTEYVPRSTPQPDDDADTPADGGLGSFLSFRPMDIFAEPEDDRDPAIRLDRSSLSLHRVCAVQVDAPGRRVRWDRKVAETGPIEPEL